MKKVIQNQEMLLNMHARFFKQEICEKSSKSEIKKLSQPDLIAELCWNGLLPEMLPQISENGLDGLPLTLWEVEQGSNLLYLRLGEMRHSVNNPYSIHPSVFLIYTSYN